MVNTALQRKLALLLIVVLTVYVASTTVAGDNPSAKKAPAKRQVAERHLAWFRTHKVMVGVISFPASIKNGRRPVVELNYPLSNFGYMWTYQVRVRLDQEITPAQMAEIRKYHKKKKHGVTLYVVLTGNGGRAFEFTGTLLGYGTWPRRKRNRVMHSVREFDDQDINPEVFHPLVN